MRHSKFLQETLSFPSIARNLLIEKGWDREEFLFRTELSSNNYYQICRGEKKAYSKRIAVTLLVAFQPGPVWNEILLRIAGHTLNPTDPIDLAYAELLADKSCCDTTTANDRLTQLGIPAKYHLGSTPF